MKWVNGLRLDKMMPTAFKRPVSTETILHGDLRTKISFTIFDVKIASL